MTLNSSYFEEFFKKLMNLFFNSHNEGLKLFSIEKKPHYSIDFHGAFYSLAISEELNILRQCLKISGKLRSRILR